MTDLQTAPPVTSTPWPHKHRRGELWYTGWVDYAVGHKYEFGCSGGVCGEGCERVWRYSQIDNFEVDGVTYRRRRAYSEGPMIEAVDDIHASGAYMDCREPALTEAELDAWVKDDCPGAPREDCS